MRNAMGVFLVLGLMAGFGHVALAQDPSRPQLDSLAQTGKLVTATLVPKSKTLTFSVVGAPSAKMSLDTLKVEAVVVDQNGERPLKTTRLKAGSYLLEDYAPANEVRIRASNKTHMDEFKFKVENKLN